jgi:hypothetical protein
MLRCYLILKIIIKGEMMIRQSLVIASLLTIVSGESMPITAQPGQCFTKSFYPPKETKTIKTTSTKKVILSKSTIKHKVIPAQYEWITQRVKISDGTEKIVTTPAVYQTVYKKILVEPAKLTWRKNLNNNAPKAFNSCVQSASMAGMNITGATAGTCFYEHYQPEKYITTTQKILASEASERIVSIPAKYRTYTKKIVTDSTTAKLIPVAAKYKKVKENVLVAPARTEWKKTTCQDRGCNQSEVVCLTEVPKHYKTVTKKVILKPAVAKRVSISPLYKHIEIRELVEPATIKTIPIPATYKTISKKEKVAEAKFSWSDVSTRDTSSRIHSQCDKICLTKAPAKYKHISRRVVLAPAHSQKITTPPKYTTIKIKKIIKPAEFKEIIVPAEYKIVKVEKERTRGFSKWMPVVCESNMTPTTVRKVQEALKEAGFYHGAIDGIWSLEAKSATREYQKAYGLTVTRLSIETMKSLGIY